jgi:hypothetical protein
MLDSNAEAPSTRGTAQAEQWMPRKRAPSRMWEGKPPKPPEAIPPVEPHQHLLPTILNIRSASKGSISSTQVRLPDELAFGEAMHMKAQPPEFLQHQGFRCHLHTSNPLPFPDPCSHLLHWLTQHLYSAACQMLKCHRF